MYLIYVYCLYVSFGAENECIFLLNLKHKYISLVRYLKSIQPKGKRFWRSLALSKALCSLLKPVRLPMRTCVYHPFNLWPLLLTFFMLSENVISSPQFMELQSRITNFFLSFLHWHLLSTYFAINRLSNWNLFIMSIWSFFIYKRSICEKFLGPRFSG